MDNADFHSHSQEPSDDAGGGQRGPRPPLTGELMAFLNDEYGFDKAAKYTDLGGSACLNLRVDTGDNQYVARIYRRYVPSARLVDIFRVKSTLNQSGIPCPMPIQTVNRRNWTICNGSLVEVERYVPHTGTMDSLGKLRMALPTMGRMTAVLSGIDDLSADGNTPRFVNHISVDRIAEMTQTGCARIMGWDPTDYERDVARASMELAGKIIRAGGRLLSGLPRQLAHGDFWDNNVLFDGDHMASILDFDFMGVRNRIDDIALTLYFTNYSLSYDPKFHTGSDAQSLQRARELKELTRLYETGLTQPLTQDERLALPIALAMQPLWSIGGWIVLLDDERAARHHASDMLWYVDWANHIMDHLGRWQAVFSP